ncbi:S53 family peptidase [Jatrophihabitans sp.]|uniref:S53 family peptidase n=1 Tax=Jatrophihabitans sp. TaxID=1932789 RepID=UPI002CB66C3A|nr:S53 family peptidase [Jatrophihabitans sp.]
MALAAGAFALPVVVAAGLPAAATPTGRALLHDAPAWTASAKALGAAPAGKIVNFSVAIAPRDAAGAQAFADAVSDPHSASYRHFLTPEQYTARFGATNADVAAVVNWLQGAGLQTGAVPISNSYVPVTGSVAAVNKALGTTIKSYSRNNQNVTAPASALTVPSVLAGRVSDVLGLDSSEIYRTGAKVSPNGASAGNVTCSTYWGENTNTSYIPAPAPLSGNQPNRACYTPSRLNAARGIPATGKTGAGVTVGNVLWCDSPTIPSDLNTWAAQVGAPAFTAGQYTSQDPATWDAYCTNQANVDGTMVETALDAEAIHGAAPDAKIIYAPAAGPYSNYLLTATQNLVNANQVSIITNSWGGAESNSAWLHSVYVQAASQGISVMASSGDDGDNTYSNGSASKARPSADYPASDSQLTSIGGTSLGIDSTNSTLFEQAWYDVISRSSGTTWTSDVFYGASGGGKSAITSQPSYQTGIVSSTFSGKPAKRAYPDIANIADSQTGYVVGVTQAGAYTTLTVGGTSLASPYTAGEVALAVQTKGARLGFLNPKLYQNRATAVSDVSGSTVNRGTEGKWKNPSTGTYIEPTTYFLNGMSLLPSSQQSVAGWDNITGLGAVANASNFITAIQ